jgi:hypothetical protein
MVPLVTFSPLGSPLIRCRRHHDEETYATGHLACDHPDGLIACDSGDDDEADSITLEGQERASESEGGEAGGVVDPDEEATEQGAEADG